MQFGSDFFQFFLNLLNIITCKKHFKGLGGFTFFLDLFDLREIQIHKLLNIIIFEMIE